MNDTARRPGERYGAMVISLDFELHWGVRDKQSATGTYAANLRGARAAVPKLLDAFERYGVAATWATVGLLFAGSRSELERYVPSALPTYRDKHLSPYDETVGESEEDDPLHYASSLIRLVLESPRQEIGTHTFSHFYCLEDGQREDEFASDIEAAVSIARSKGVQLKSIVFPRNQHNPLYEAALHKHGITCYRGNQKAWMYRAATEAEESAAKRAARLIDTYVNVGGRHTTPWSRLQAEGGRLCDVPASHFVRPYSPRLRHLEAARARRIKASMTHAARRQEIVHLWWHPHNFGRYTKENMRFIKRLFEHYRDLRDRYGMQSLAMSEVAERVFPTPAEQ
jgi:peptidoglycan/xylan/chitin deacetylase (PgdA/CDA1 family)